nr:hypothetical protein [Tanacetum cinerariifolium]
KVPAGFGGIGTWGCWGEGVGTVLVGEGVREGCVGKTGVDTPLFDGMLVLQQAQDVEDPAKDEDDVNEVSAKPTPPSPIPTIPPPPQ